MSRLEQLETQIAELNPSELKALREWFDRYDAVTRLKLMRRAASCPI
jgi:hypothetical protein